ncbi:MAG TPA: hypothetical protein PLC15_01805 [Candidatus Obscuribacter sp.]|nr:hypothetical protein [Candidatus Obscuribacter sp.]HMX44430.1 hypothetical protein [Candidatus Obscuribacter sp.]HNB14080.1 hypothetical protein [Candidatus Obscuribacter sp.]HNG21019.1 hypothetical protein [Candidatus Obscuribacter sp.]
MNKLPGSFKVVGSALALLLALAGPFLQPACADERGWVLTQRSTNFGDAYIYISPSGMKMVSPKLGCNIVTCAPGWSVAFYNDKTRQFYSTTYEKWTNDLTAKMASKGQSLSDLPWTRGSVGGVSGLKATQYSIRNARLSPRGGARRQQVSAADCWVADEIQVPSQVSAMISKAYGLPNTRSFPLRISLVTNGNPQTVLDTYRAQSCAIPNTYFGVPAGYARASSEAEVMMDDETKQMFNDLVSDAPGVSGGNNASAPTPVQNYGGASGGGSQPTYAQPTASTAPAAGTGSSASVALPGGYSLDREKLIKIRDALMKGNK